MWEFQRKNQGYIFVARLCYSCLISVRSFVFSLFFQLFFRIRRRNQRIMGTSEMKNFRETRYV